MAPRGAPHCLLALLLLLPLAAGAGDAERADAIHRRAIVVDGHNDVAIWLLDYGFDLGMDGAEPADRWAWVHFMLPWLPGRPAPERLRTHTDLARMQAGGLDAQFFSVWVDTDHYDVDDPIPGQARARADAILDAFDRQFEAHADRIALARSAGDVRRIVASGRHAALLGLEGGHAIEDDLDTLRHYYRRGVRYMTLTWSFSHTWADATGDPMHPTTERHGGLTDFGRSVVREMNDLGMLVDISHVSDRTFWDALEVTRAPLIASHSSARAVTDVPRNLSDEMLRAVAANGGVVMINFAVPYLDDDWVWNWFGAGTGVTQLADHIDHVVRVAGIDHVGLGSDFDGTPILPTDLADVSQFPNLTLELVRRGYDEPEILKILGENALRVLARAEEAAALRPAPAVARP